MQERGVLPRLAGRRLGRGVAARIKEEKGDPELDLLVLGEEARDEGPVMEENGGKWR